MNIQLKLTKSEIITLKNAIEHFDIFFNSEVPVDESKWSESDRDVDTINSELEDVYDQLLWDNIIDFSEKDLSNSLSALYVYKEIVLHDIKTPKNIKRSKAEKDLAVQNISSLFQYLYETLSEFAPGTDISLFEFTPDTELI